MDVEKVGAEVHLKKLLDEIRRHGVRKGPRRGNAVWESIRAVVGWMFGFHPHRPHDGESPLDNEFSDYLGNLNKDESEILDDGHPLPPEPHTIGNVPCGKLKAAVKRVQRVNKLLSSFERGFISEGGIKDREWYRHLGVAPGKWLGE